MTTATLPPIVVASLYRFVRIETPETLRRELLAFLQAKDIRGTLLVAPEGINGTVAGSRRAIDALRDRLDSDPRFTGLSFKESCCDEPPFARTKVKLKREIVTMGVPGIDPNQSAGTYVEPQQWNDLIRDPEVVVIDTRNDYEIGVGTFTQAIDPGISTFREFPDYVNRHLDPARTPKVAMFCTGGIRCEKSTAYLKQRGFDEVYHLRGGILQYLEEVPAEDSEWQGECFVFDERVTVTHDLECGHYAQCHACRRPVSAQDQRDVRYVPGVSCPHCHAETTPEQRRRFAEREKQVRLASDRHESHIGDGGRIEAIRAQRREHKLQRKNRQRDAASGDQNR